MYTEMWNNINRHLTIVWQSVGVLAGAFAGIALLQRQAVTLDLATSLIVIVATWHVGHVYDANTWFNRNLGIIANIERQFLSKDDARLIHFYFAEGHRRPGTLVSHLKVQFYFGIGVATIAIVYHAASRLVPLLGQSLSCHDLVRCLPYVTAVGCFAWLHNFRSEQVRKQSEFSERSPGAQNQG
jgi:hypothetical protein